MVRVSSPAKLRPWSELNAQNGDGGGSRAFGVTESRFRRKTKLACWAAATY